MTATPGFNPFFGTSAAAPHAAAIAGLMLSVDPGLDTADIRNVFNRTALDIEAPGVDRDSGVGIVDAFDALSSLAAAPALAVTPSGAFKPKGRAGGPFKPKKKTYELTNTGAGPLSWRASDNKKWLKVRPSSGALNAGQSTSVKVKLKKSIVNRLRAKRRAYKGQVSFTNVTNGMGNTVRQVKLKVRPRSRRRTVSTASIE